MTSPVTPYIPLLQAAQNRLMTDVADIYRNDLLVLADVKCRVTSNRLFAEPADPQDANMRSMAEWGVTFPSGTNVKVGDRLAVTTTTKDIDIIVGEVVEGDTWEIATRAWGNRPKVATPAFNIVLYRYDITLDDYVALAAQPVNLVYDRNQPKGTPTRFAPAGHATYQGGWLIGTTAFNVQIEDRFEISGIGGVIVEVLPLQPQRKEARFVLDITGVR